MNKIVKKLYGEENSFNPEKFKNPSVSYAPLYNWIWNGPVSHEETDRQLDEMQRLGIKAVAIIPEPKSFRPTFMPTLMEPDYLTPPYFEEYKYAVLSAKKRGMLMCLYDEGGWPSGGACGRVLLKHPEFARKSLDTRKICCKKGETYTMPDDTIVAFDGNCEVKEGNIFDKDCEITEYYIFCSPFSSGISDFPDITVKEATEAFIEETHEGYKKYLKEFFGDVILTVFTDEPTAPRKFPYRKEIEELFEKENGYSIHPFLPEITGNCEPTADGIKAKIALFDLCSRLICNNFFLIEKEWTNNNNMAYIGHVDTDHITSKCCTESGNFNLMRSLRCFDIPGIDVIWHQITNKKVKNPRESDDDINGIFPRYASSAASQTGERYSLTESIGVYGGGTDFNLMRYVFNYQAVRGINMFNVFSVPYGRVGFLMTGELPYFTEKHACYKDLSVFNNFAERLSYLASLGERQADVALYMPVCDIQAEINDDAAKAFDKAGKELENSRVLFDIADDDVFEYVDNGKIKMGIAQYNTVVVPSCDYMPEKTKSQLEKFISGGGNVFVIGDKPSIDGAKYVCDTKSILTSPVKLSGDTDMIRLNVRTAENGTLYMLFNESDDSKLFEVVSKYDYILDAENGKIVKPNSNKITLASGQMAFLWQGKVDEFEKENTYNNEITLENFTFSRTDRFIISDMEFVKQEIAETEVPVSLGDWAEITGIDFSGSGIYKTEFTLPENKGKICIDLGDVYSSCEIFINGKSYGICGMSPYIYEIDTENLCDRNTLEIRVSNTSANEYLYTKSFDKWQKWQVSPYHETQNLFHKDSLQGGLYGPVKILY